MAQAQITSKKMKNLKSTGTQTGQTVDVSIALCRNKRARFYWSQSYRDFVLAFNINKSKSFILDRQMWKKLRIHLEKIDHVLAR